MAEDMGHWVLDVMVERCWQGTLNSAISSLPESDLSTLLHFHTPGSELLWEGDVKLKSVCFQIQECLSLEISNKLCNSFACMLIQGTREMSACFFRTYYELINTTRLFFKAILKIFSLRKQSIIGKANKSVFKGLLSYYPYCNWLLQALMMDEHIRTARI